MRLFRIGPKEVIDLLVDFLLRLCGSGGTVEPNFVAGRLAVFAPLCAGARRCC